MSLTVYGMDVGFYSHLGSYSLEARCEMLAELGCGATNLTLWSERAWSDLDRLDTVASTTGLEVAALYTTVDVTAPLDAPEVARVLRLIERHGHHPIELALTAGDGVGDAAAGAHRFLDRALDVAAASGAKLRLYPHFAFWLERVDDTLTLLRAYDTDRLGLTFPAFHVYALEGAGFLGALDRAAPYLRGANTNGSRRLAGQYFPVTIEPVGEGDFDNFAFLGRLRELGFDAPLGIQAYGVGGDAYEHVRRSVAAVRDIERRLDTHAHWARLVPDPL